MRGTSAIHGNSMKRKRTRQLSPVSIFCSVVVGGGLANDTFTVRNAGIGNLQYAITDNVDWLACTPTDGTSTGKADTITVSYTTGGLSGGMYQAVTTVTDPQASNSPL